MNPPIERLTFRIWPQAPRDYSLATVAVRWEQMKAIYQAERIREMQKERKQ